MKLAILGAGNGGVAMAADWAYHGHDVSLFDFKKFETQINAINQQGGIIVEGVLNGFVKLKYAGFDIEKAIESVDIIAIVGPAYSTKPFAQALKPYIKDGQHVVVCPGSIGGGIILKNELGISYEDDSIIVAETSTLPYASRNIEPGKVHIYNKLKGGLYISALPIEKTDVIKEAFDQVYKAFTTAKHYFQTMLQNANPVIHPAVSLLNAGRIDSPTESFLFYEEGVTPYVGRLIEAVDAERIKIGKAFGIDILPDPVIGVQQGYMILDNYETGYSTAPGFKGVMAQSQMDHRYINEDVGYGLVFMKELANKLNVETPVIDSVINISSAVMKRDYLSEHKRSLKSLGIDMLSVEDMFKLFST